MVLRTLIIVVLALLAGACEERKTEYSGVMRQAAEVTEVAYSPARTDIGMKCGFDFDGDYHCWPAIVNTPAWYRVTVRSKECEIVLRTRPFYEEFKNFKGSKGTLRYREVYLVIYDVVGDERREQRRVFLYCEYEGFERAAAQTAGEGGP